MSDHDTTPGAPETEARVRVQVETLAMLISQTLAPAWWNGDRPDQYATADGLETYEVPDGQDYDLAHIVIAAGWITPTEAATRDAAQRAAALYEARDALYRGEGPDAFEDADIRYGEWLGNRADRIGGSHG